MKSNFLILLTNVYYPRTCSFDGRIDIEFVNMQDVSGSYYYAIRDKKMSKYPRLNYKDLLHNIILKKIKIKPLHYYDE
jgi:hypothetical protein